MTDIYVTDAGFAAYQPTGAVIALDVTALPERQAEALEEALATKGELHILFASPADGRGFSLARQLRLLGFEGRLIARGAILSDQYRQARQSGFDGVLLSEAQADKMPEAYWLEQARRVALSYQERLYS